MTHENQNLLNIINKIRLSALSFHSLAAIVPEEDETGSIIKVLTQNLCENVELLYVNFLIQNGNK